MARVRARAGARALLAALAAAIVGDLPRFARAGELDALYVQADDMWYGRNDVPQDQAAALGLFYQAAEQGDVMSQEFLAKVNRRGVVGVVNEDPYEAFLWAEKAAEQGGKVGMEMLADLYYNGKGLNSADELTERDRMMKAAEWWQRAAEKGSMHSMSNLADLYRMGKGVQKDYKQALHWYEKAVANFKQDDLPNKQTAAKTYNSLGAMYYSGWGTAKDTKKGMELFGKAAMLGHDGARKNLESMRKANKEL
eukprot:TRINITY_DN4571_c1_g1_i1.p1 TRINITY_DN4571_c1_g1~~TRINITY_DN4571_c1_g1_i1.p1  ORF type:complete len:269 (-),score=81.24 TRINITY_DN4571_c1_g1_i1:93-848(-)